MVTLVSCIVQILKHATGELVSADLEWTLSVISMNWICTHVDHVATGFKVSVIARDVERRELVGVLLVQSFFGESSDANFEVLYNVIVLSRL